MSPFKSEVVLAPMVLKHGEAAALIVLPSPVECPRCHRAVRLAVNRDGKTLCLGCDETTMQTSAPSK